MRNLLPCAVLGLALIACDLEALDPDTATDRGAQADRRPPAGEGDQHAGPKGPPAMMLVGAALHGDVLDDEQREDLRPALEALHAAHRETRETHDAIHASAIDGVTVGRLDPEDHGHALDVLKALAGQEAKAMENALATLHRLLEPAQRASLVDAIDSIGLPKDGPDDAQGPTRPARDALRGLAEALALSDEQIAELRDALAEPAPLPGPASGDELQAQLAAFASPDFDPNTLGLTTLHPQHVRARAEGWLTLLAALLTVIDDDQHDTLVEHLRERADARP